MATSNLNPDGTPKSLMQIAAEQIAANNKIDPTMNTFDETKGVAGRVNSIIAADSPLMQQAATRGLQQAASRGLTNSTLGIQAGQEAVIGAATPIAQSDASLFQQTQLANQNATNSSKQANAQIGATLGGQGLSLDNSNTQQTKSIAEAGRQFDVGTAQNAQQFGVQNDLQKAQLAQQLVMQGADLATREKLAGIEAQFKGAIQSDTNITNAWGSMMTNINAIQNNPNLDADAKTTLINNTQAAFGAFTSFWQKTTTNPGTDVSALLNFGTTSAGEQAPVPANAPGFTPGAGAVPYGGYTPVQYDEIASAGG